MLDQLTSRTRLSRRLENSFGEAKEFDIVLPLATLL
jgi:hypothetical protein